jgi:hypothetical protein
MKKKNENNNPGSYLKLTSTQGWCPSLYIHGTIIKGQVYKLVVISYASGSYHL